MNFLIFFLIHHSFFSLPFPTTSLLFIHIHFSVALPVVVVLLDVVPDVGPADVVDVAMDAAVAAIFPRPSNAAQSYNSTKCITFPIPTVAKRPRLVISSMLVNANVKMDAKLVVGATLGSMHVLLDVDATQVIVVRVDTQDFAIQDAVP